MLCNSISYIRQKECTIFSDIFQAISGRFDPGAGTTVTPQIQCQRGRYRAMLAVAWNRYAAARLIPPVRGTTAAWSLFGARAPPGEKRQGPDYLHPNPTLNAIRLRVARMSPSS
jgi:hypothetical protein